MQIKILVFLIVISLFQACIEEFSPKITAYANLPVIDGTITNEPGPYIVKLSKSLAVDDLGYFPVTGANIKISDNLNTEETLTEIKPGVYSTDSMGIRGIVGRKYRITVKIEDKTYQSNFEELKNPSGIDSVYTKIESKETAEGNFEGLQFYINTEDTNDKNRYFLWKLIETYKYKPGLQVEYLYYFYSDSIASVENDSINEFVNINNECWSSEKIKDIYTYSTQNFTDSKVNNFALHYVNTDTKKLSEKYSLLINQYSITKDAYEYWNEIKKQNAESGSLYTTQPFQTRGNLVNIDNIDDIILGYFMVAGISKKRIYIDPPHLDFIENCVSSYDYYLYLINLPIPPELIFITNKSGDGKRESAAMRCLDCREEGGTLTKPDFWED